MRLPFCFVKAEPPLHHSQFELTSCKVVRTGHAGSFGRSCVHRQEPCKCHKFSSHSLECSTCQNVSVRKNSEARSSEESLRHPGRQYKNRNSHHRTLCVIQAILQRVVSRPAGPERCRAYRSYAALHLENCSEPKFGTFPKHVTCGHVRLIRLISTLELPAHMTRLKSL